MPELHEEQFFFENHGLRLFGVLHRPVDGGTPRRFGWVCCGPFGEERGFSHRLYVEWARVLCQEGFHVLRFDCRGYGDSEGRFGEFTIEDNLDDVRAAIQELERRAGIPVRGLFGIRLGATLAMRAAKVSSGDSLLVLWEPVVHGEQYVGELLRSALASQMTGPLKERTTRAELRSQLASGGQVFVRGHGLTERLCRSLASLNLLAEGGLDRHPALIVQIRSRPESRPRRVLEDLCGTAVGGHAELQVFDAPPLWDGQHHGPYAARVRPVALFDSTVRWVTRQVSIKERRTPSGAADAGVALAPIGAPDAGGGVTLRRGARPVDSVRATPIPDAEERPVRFAVDGTHLRGILHIPKDHESGRPGIIITPQGINCRTGFNRLSVKLARELARAGWASLRFDGRGLGDSEGRADFATGSGLFLAIQQGLHIPDTAAAIDFMARAGFKAVILTGVCGGAVTAVLVAAMSHKVVGVAPVELVLQYTAPLGSLEAPPPWVYRRKFLSWKSWRQVFSLRADFRAHMRWTGEAIMKRLRPQTTSNDLADTRRLASRLGTRVNLELIAALRSWWGRRMPTLCVFGGTENGQYFSKATPDLIQGLDVTEDRLSLHTVRGADHDFLLPEHSEALTGVLAEWLEQFRACVPSQELPVPGACT